jgi:hypothetical protein
LRCPAAGRFVADAMKSSSAREGVAILSLILPFIYKGNIEVVGLRDPLDEPAEVRAASQRTAQSNQHLRKKLAVARAHARSSRRKKI